MNFPPATDRMLAELREATSNDDTSTRIRNYLKKGMAYKKLSSNAH